MAWMGAAIAGGASLVGGMMNSASQAGANSTNRQIAEEEMNWQTQMSNTAEQRHVADLTAAGLNPALAYQTAAPVPGSAPIANVQATNPGSAVAAAGTAVAQQVLATRQANAQIDATQAQADNTRAETATKLATLPFAGSTAQQNLDNMAETQSQIRAQANRLFQDYNITDNMYPDRIRQLNNDVNFQQAMQPIQLGVGKLDFQRQQLGMPKVINESNAQDSWWMRRVAPFLPGGTSAIDSGVNAAAKIAPLF